MRKLQACISCQEEVPLTAQDVSHCAAAPCCSGNSSCGRCHGVCFTPEPTVQAARWRELSFFALRSFDGAAWPTGQSNSSVIKDWWNHSHSASPTPSAHLCVSVWGTYSAAHGALPEAPSEPRGPTSGQSDVGLRCAERAFRIFFWVGPNWALRQLRFFIFAFYVMLLSHVS